MVVRGLVMNGLERMDRRLLCENEWIQFNKERWMIKE